MRHRCSFLLLVLSVLALAGCGGGSNSSSKAGLVPQGQWGNDSQSAELTVTSIGATFQNASADGVISQAISADDSGHFDVAGNIQRVGGPPPIPGTTTLFPAQYTGTIDGKMMTLTITETASDGTTSTRGPYTLTYGKTVTITPVP